MKQTLHQTEGRSGGQVKFPVESSRTSKRSAPATSFLVSAELAASTDTKRAEKVATIIAQAADPAASPVMPYLRSRGITIALPDCIRYRPKAFGAYGAMVALATDHAGEVLAVQQVYLTPEGTKASVTVVKRTNKTVDGWASHAAVRFPGSAPVVLCEGVETALSIWQATGQEVWACLGISNIGCAPVPDRGDVIVARDGDRAGSPAGKQIVRAASALAERGSTVMIATPPAGQDFNDVLILKGNEAVRSCINSAERFRPGHAETSCKQLDIGSDVEVAARARKDLIARYGRIAYTEGDFWRYTGTHWEVISQDHMRSIVHQYDGAAFSSASGQPSRVKLGRGRIDSILHECASICAEPGFFQPQTGGINCASGFIRIDTDGSTRLGPHDPEHGCRHVLPGRWHPENKGTPPSGSLLAGFLKGIFLGDKDAEAKVQLLKEICGVAALGYATRLVQPRAVILYGKTAENGKSQFLDLARGLLPPSAVCSISAARMADERHVIGLRGKLLNASDELSSAAVSSDTFKAIVTGEPIDGRELYRSRVEFRSVAQNVFATNKLISFKGGLDRGVQRRILIISFCRTIPMGERVENIGKRIATEEADLLLAWAVEGAADLIRQRNFTIPESSKEEMNEWLFGHDPVLAWIDSCTEVQPIYNGGPKLATRDAYRLFSMWAAAEGFKPNAIPGINGFVQRVQAQVAGIDKKRAASGPYFLGLFVTHR
ncbi:toprim domain-containing protein [Paracoccus gahaiensis]